MTKDFLQGKLSQDNKESVFTDLSVMQKLRLKNSNIFRSKTASNNWARPNYNSVDQNTKHERLKTPEANGVLNEYFTI
jgi:hypothetical protein